MGAGTALGYIAAFALYTMHQKRTGHAPPLLTTFAAASSVSSMFSECFYCYAFKNFNGKLNHRCAYIRFLVRVTKDSGLGAGSSQEGYGQVWM